MGPLFWPENSRWPYIKNKAVNGAHIMLRCCFNQDSPFAGLWTHKNAKLRTTSIHRHETYFETYSVGSTFLGWRVSNYCVFHMCAKLRTFIPALISSLIFAVDGFWFFFLVEILLFLVGKTVRWFYWWRLLVSSYFSLWVSLLSGHAHWKFYTVYCCNLKTDFEKSGQNFSIIFLLFAVTLAGYWWLSTIFFFF